MDWPGLTGLLSLCTFLHTLGDTGDNWELLFKGEYWRRDTPLRLRHKDTGKFLHASMNVKFGNPIPGQLEVRLASL